MSLFSPSRFFPLLYSSRGVTAGAALVLGAANVTQAAIFKNGFVDHSLCCPAGGPLSFDGTPVRNSSVRLVAANTSVSPPSLEGRTVSAPATATAAASPDTKAPASAPKEVDGHLLVEFAQLADFTIESPAFDPAAKPESAMAAVDQQIPAPIKQLDGRGVQISGFMLPVKMEGQLVSEFLLMRDQMMCCYGVTPRMNDWVVVRAAKPVRFTPDVPVSFRGKFQVKAMQEQGFLTGVYLLADAAPGKM